MPRHTGALRVTQRKASCLLLSSDRRMEGVGSQDEGGEQWRPEPNRLAHPATQGKLNFMCVVHAREGGPTIICPYCLASPHWMLSLTLCLSFFSLFKQEHRHSSTYTTTPFLTFLPPSFFLSMFRLIISFLWSPFLCPCLFHFPLHGYSTSRIFTISLRPPDHQQQRHSEQIFIITAVLSPHSKPAVSDAWGVGPSELCFNRPPRGSDACSSLRPLVLEGNVSFTKTCEYL